MKKLLKLNAVIVSLALVLSFSACSDKDKTPNKGDSENPVQSSQSSDISGYESEKYNLKYTPPEGYVMYSDAELAAQSSSASSTNYEMISEHSNGFPHVMVISEKTDAADVNEYLETLKSNFSGNGNTTTELSEKEIAGRIFKTFTVTTADGIVESFYAERSGDEYLCIAIITYSGISTADESEVIDAFSAIK